MAMTSPSVRSSSLLLAGGGTALGMAEREAKVTAKNTDSIVDCEGWFVHHNGVHKGRPSIIGVQHQGGLWNCPY